MSDTILDEIHCATLIRADADLVYEALATAQGLDAWFTTGAETDPRPGGFIAFRWEDFGPDRVTTEDRAIVMEAERGKRLMFQWHPDSPAYATTVEINLEQKNDKTVVRLREHGYLNTPSGLRAMLDCASGWGEALTLLKFFLEHGVRY